MFCFGFFQQTLDDRNKNTGSKVSLKQHGIKRHHSWFIWDAFLVLIPANRHDISLRVFISRRWNQLLRILCMQSLDNTSHWIVKIPQCVSLWDKTRHAGFNCLIVPQPVFLFAISLHLKCTWRRFEGLKVVLTRRNCKGGFTAYAVRIGCGAYALTQIARTRITWIKAW